MTTPSASLEDAHLATRRITRLSVAAAVLLIALKAFALGASGSVSILASLADSVLDLVASLGAFYAVRWAAAPPDEEHRYGHGKGEALAALVQSGLVFASAVFIGWEAIQRILDPRPVMAGGWATGASGMAPCGSGAGSPGNGSGEGLGAAGAAAAGFRGEKSLFVIMHLPRRGGPCRCSRRSPAAAGLRRPVRAGAPNG